jgi:hypothetical protein
LFVLLPPIIKIEVEEASGPIDNCKLTITNCNLKLLIVNCQFAMKPPLTTHSFFSISFAK